ncbi:MAG TPA: EF-P lysine aminoacylase EpmA [Solimonas sp.]|nr:EF-P lysine aminoacylase EpmA [Solimonas sp.]
MKSAGEDHWRPSAELQTLKARAELFGSVRAFFSARGIMEVDTPILSAHATVDRQIESFAVPNPESQIPNPGFLATSPEFAMKRLLAAGSGPIWQIAHVFRREEAGRFHNPEFALLEWYRPGFDHHRLMDEVDELLQAVGAASAPCERWGYREAFQRHAQLDPFAAPIQSLRAAAPAIDAGEQDAASRDFWLDLLMSHRVGPKLGADRPCFVHSFPASQAALARVQGGVAERFEVFWRGLELANGFHELTDAAEQQARFEADREWRRSRGKAVPPYDRHLIAALQAGLPPCAGVALGLDRLLMLLLGLPKVASAMPFAADRA